MRDCSDSAESIDIELPGPLPRSLEHRVQGILKADHTISEGLAVTSRTETPAPSTRSITDTALAMVCVDSACNGAVVAKRIRGARRHRHDRGFPDQRFDLHEVAIRGIQCSPQRPLKVRAQPREPVPSRAREFFPKELVGEPTFAQDCGVR